MKMFSDNDLRLYVADQVRTAIALHEEAALDTIRKRDENHGWEVRRLTGRAEDAETDRDKFRAAYKAAISRLKGYRRRLATATRNLQAAGLAESEPSADGSPKLDSVQAIMDAAVSGIPGMDDMSQNAVRSYIERQLRSRGSSKGPEILQEVLDGESLED